MNDDLCGRVGCGEPAIAVLLMSPQDTQAWIVAPDHEFAPEGVPLCPAHADRISVPFGWSLTDDRPAPKKKRRRKKAAAPKPDPVDIGAEAAADPLPEPFVEPEPEPEPAPDIAEPSVDPDSWADALPDGEAAEPTVEQADPAAEPTRTADDDDAEDGYVAPEYQFREEAGSLDEPTIQMPAVNVSAPTSPSEVPLDAEKVAVAVDDDAPRLSVVPGDDDPNKTYDFSDEGQGAFWHEPEPAEAEPDESTPLLQRAFRVVRDD